MIVQGYTLFTFVFFPVRESTNCCLLTLMENLRADVQFPRLLPTTVKTTVWSMLLSALFPRSEHPLSVERGWVESNLLPLCCSEPSQAVMLCPPQICSNDPCQSIHPTSHMTASQSLSVVIPSAWCPALHWYSGHWRGASPICSIWTAKSIAFAVAVGRKTDAYSWPCTDR